MPAKRTPAQQSKGPTQLKTQPKTEVKTRELTDAEIREALTKMGDLMEAVRAVERVKEEFAKSRGEGNVIDVSSPDHPKYGKIMSRRGKPIVDLYTLFDFPDRVFKADPANPAKWREVKGSEVPKKQAHSHLKAELIEVTKPDGTKERYLSIPKAAAARNAVLRWAGRPEGAKLKS